MKKGPENRKNEVNLRPPLCRPLKHSIKFWHLGQFVLVTVLGFSKMVPSALLAAFLFPCALSGHSCCKLQHIHEHPGAWASKASWPHLQGRGCELGAALVLSSLSTNQRPPLLPIKTVHMA